MDGKLVLFTVCVCIFSFVLPIICVYTEPSKHPYIDPVEKIESGNFKPWITLEMTAMIGARAEQCFHQHLKEGYYFTIDWRVLGTDIDRSFRFAVRSPDGAIMYITYTVLYDSFHTDIEEDGVYTFCFGNEASKWAERRVSMVVSIVHQAKTESYYDVKVAEGESKKNMSFSLTKVMRAIDETSKYQAISKQHLRQDWELLNANLAYVLYWSVALCCIIISAAAVQVWALKSLFKTKILTPSARPRC